jgi:DNA-3-methyladenine glycosylase
VLLKPSFFKKDAVIVAKNLLGNILKYKSCSGVIVETEAYKADPASHAWKMTPRSEIMFTSFAKWYIYFIYGMYFCLNITTNKNEAGAVLIRAVQPLTGLKEMKKRRKTNNIKELCSGPGKLCQAFGITKALNGTKLNDKIKILPGKKPKKIKRTSRIGIKRGTELDWRFYIPNNEWVSCK